MDANHSANPAESTTTQHLDVYPVSEKAKAHAHITSLCEYQRLYDESIQKPDVFWGRLGKELVDWYHPFDKTVQGSLGSGNLSWFVNGKLNICYNALDRHLAARGDEIAIMYESNEPGEGYNLTYRQLHAKVCQLANYMSVVLGVKKGDRVAIYQPMTPQSAISMLACARIGAIHSVVFAGFSAEALAARIQDSNCVLLLTANESCRGEKRFPLKGVVDKALENCPSIKNVIVHQRTDTPCSMTQGRDVWWHDVVPTQRPYCPCIWMDAEDPWFLLYTSGSTGKPKGIQHSIGAIVYILATMKYVWDLTPTSNFFCGADVGWITGHSYNLYGPLCIGASTVFFECPPTFPDASRYWSTCEKFGVTHFYTAPTAYRILQTFGAGPIGKHDISKLRVIGTVGEPISPEAWRWVWETIGQKSAAIVDTWWQTETIGNAIVTIPGVHKTIPGSAGVGFFGIRPVLINPETGKEIDGAGTGVLCIGSVWPGMVRTVWNNHERYLNTYLNQYPGYYFTGDSASRNEDGYITIGGRVDDVINVSGHRLGTAELEAALVTNDHCAEAAVIVVEHPVKGHCIIAYVVVPEADFNNITADESEDIVKSLKSSVVEHIGAFARPEMVILTRGVPKTRSGKLMRRLLRKITTREENLGDISTLANPEIVAHLKANVPHYFNKYGWS